MKSGDMTRADGIIMVSAATIGVMHLLRTDVATTMSSMYVETRSRRPVGPILLTPRFGLTRPCRQ